MGLKTKEFMVWPAMLILAVRVCAAGETEQARPVPVLSESTRQLMERGIVAADAKEWATASQYFLQAQKNDPLQPKVLFNLGFSLMNEGRNVPADLWLRAYLGLNPGAANAAQIEKEVRKLDVSIDVTSGKLIEEAIAQMGNLADPMTPAEQEAFQMPADASAMAGQKIPPNMEQRRGNTLGAILFAQTATGRITEALNFAARMNLTNVNPDSLRRYFGQIQVDAGDFEGAVSTLKEIQSPGERDLLLSAMVIGEIAAERLGKAEEHAASVSSPEEKLKLFNVLFLKYIRQLEVEKAEDVFSRQNLTGDAKARLLSRLTAGYLKKEMTDKARGFAQEILNTADPAEIRQLDSVTLALAALGRGAEAVSLVQNAAGAKPRFDEAKIIETAGFLIPGLCWSGQTLEAESLMAALQGLRSAALQQTLKTTRPFVLAEKGNVEGALKALKEIDSSSRDSVIISLFWRLVQKKMDAPAAKMALASDSDLVKARLFLKLANQVTGAEAEFQKRQLRSRAFDWALSVQDVLGLRRLAQDAGREGQGELSAHAARAAAAMNWIELADYFTRIPATSDLRKHSESFKLKGFDRVPYETALAALEWGRVSVYIRARERNRD